MTIIYICVNWIMYSKCLWRYEQHFLFITGVFTYEEQEVLHVWLCKEKEKEAHNQTKLIIESVWIVTKYVWRFIWIAQVSLTPGDGLLGLHVSDFAAVFIITGRVEGDALGQMELPSSLKGQVGLLGALDLHPILHQFDINVWGVEVTHVADQHVVLAINAWVTAVNLDFWWS